jgi:Domain of unknown function (DUF4105)
MIKTITHPNPQHLGGRGVARRIGWVLGLILMGLVLLLLNLWAVAALYVDCRIAVLRIPLAAIYVGLVIFLLVWVKRWGVMGKALAGFACFCVVLVWWLSLKPSNEANWRADVARTAWAEIDGNRILVHNVRDCDYRSETEYSNCWSDRTFDLSQLRGVDFFFVNWGIPWIGHPIVSFDFGQNQHLAFSIEARYRVGQTYSSILGFFRQYELIFIVADERDVIRLRTNYRKAEEVYMYRTNVPVHIARKLFLTYIAYLNRLNDHPEWYNAVTKNCTTTINREISEDLPDPKPWTYRLLLNGTLDQLLYERGRLVTGGLAFPDLKAREHINPYAETVGQSPEFSALIRTGRVGF